MNEQTASSKFRLPSAFFVAIACYLLGIILIWAGATKIMDPATFARALDRYQLLPEFAVGPVAIILPWLELLTGIALIWAPRLRPSAAVLTTVLLGLFTAALAISAWRGLDPRCGCFGGADGASNLPLALARAAGLAALSFWATWKILPASLR